MVKRFVLVVLLSSFLLVIMFDTGSGVAVAASPSIIRVPDDYQTIQEAVDAANPGDVIFVSAGTYYENVRVNKSVSLVGESRETTIIDGNGTGDVLYVTADSVKISGFTIQNGGGLGVYLACGIVLEHSSGSIIYANTIVSNEVGGIWLNESSGNMISNNEIMDNGGGHPSLEYGFGIALEYSNSNLIINNFISNNVVEGIAISSSYGNIVANNTFTKNGVVGVALYSSSGNIVSDNVFTSRSGIEIYSSTRNTVERNQLKGCSIGIARSSADVIRGNVITESTMAGISIAEMSTNITVVGNTVSNNLYGIKIHYSNGSFIYHNNFVNNTVNAPEDVYLNVNAWDNGVEGNYWSDYAGVDLDYDGIGDTPHTLYAFNEDRFPLMAPIGFFDAGVWNGTSLDVSIVSNSTVSNFHLNRTQRTISFNVTGPDYTFGFCRVTIPNIIVQELWQNNYTILIDGEQPITINNQTDDAHTYIHFTYQHSEHKVVIIPEFAASTILSLFMITTLGAVILRKRRP